MNNNLFQKTMAISTILFACNISNSNASIYAGADLGSDTIDFKQHAHFIVPTHLDGTDKTHLSGTGIFGSLFAGYAITRHTFYLASEINANLSSATYKSSNVETYHSNVSKTYYKMNNAFGISILPGYLLSDTTLLYTRAGYSNAQFKITGNDASLGNSNHRKNGFRYGLGIKQALSQRVALRMDYSRINYNSTRLATLDTLSNFAKNTSITPRQQLIELGVVINFG